MKRVSKLLVFVIAMLSALSGFSQVEMADNFRGEGKIYIVIGVILIILAGFFYLLLRLDARAKKLEKEVRNED